MANTLVKKIEHCQSAVDLYEMKDEILEALGSKKKAVKKERKEDEE